MIPQTENALIQTLFEMSGITKESVQNELQKLIQDTVRPSILFWDIEDIVKATTFQKAFLEEHILSDPRVREFQRQRGFRGKRVWLAEPTAKVIQKIIMDEWN
ncbi:hypothetical protein MHH37_06490 [Solibacillus sp. FSL K6-1781]|uniref:hypothetical protein n=1 Tax=Solibacillus sp. FSL K6-1781 TaxID=2921474 RepID=UPI00315A392B